MKTTIKITALTAIIVLAMLACTPEVELTQRDFTEIRDAKNPKYDNVNTSNHIPVLSANTITYKAPPDTPTEAQREIKITFPVEADILSRDITTAALKEFISMYTFTNGTSSYTEVSTKESDVDFEFVSRHLKDVTIRLTAVPDKTFVIKIDATKYTFANGIKLDTNDDGIAGEAVYDDVYSAVTPSGGVNNKFTGPEINISLDIIAKTTSTNTVTTILTEQDICIATLDLGSYSSADLKSQQKAVIEALMSKIKLQKYDAASKTWVDMGSVKSVDSDTTSDADGDWYLAVSVTPQDGDIYRAYAIGMKNLTTAENFLDIKQKIAVTGSTNASYKNYMVTSDPIMFYNSNRQLQTNSPVDYCNVSSDADGRNVKLEIYFKRIDVTTGTLPNTTTTEHWLSALDTATFNKNVKLAYNYSNPNSNINNLTSSTKLDNFVFLPIKDVSYDSRNPNNLDPAPGINRITITLDPFYQISKDKNRTINLLLAPGFKYNNDLIIFGNLTTTGLNIFIDGVNCWRAYGQLGGIKL
ncbi:hypothetical protein R84B8_00466 [Treponema sp. R8-4-B8]